MSQPSVPPHLQLLRGALTPHLENGRMPDMTRNHLTDQERRHPSAQALLGEERGWGLGLSVFLEDAELPAGSFGWDGGYGTSAYVDPKSEQIGILFTQRLWDSPNSRPIRDAFWRAVAEIRASVTRASILEG